MKKIALAIVVSGGLVTSIASAATVGAGGEFVLDFDRSVTNNHPLPLTLNRFYSAAEVDGKTQAELISGAAGQVATGPFTLDVYGSTAPSNAADPRLRNPQATNFNFTNPNPGAGTGQIGLGGVMVYSNDLGTATAGDFSFTPSGSDWILKSNIGGLPSDVFLLTDITTGAPDGDNFTLSGNVQYASALVANFLSGGDTTGTNVGLFSFTTVDPAVAAAEAAAAQAAADAAAQQAADAAAAQAAADAAAQAAADAAAQQAADAAAQAAADAAAQAAADAAAQTAADAAAADGAQADADAAAQAAADAALAQIAADAAANAQPASSDAAGQGGSGGAAVSQVPVPAAVWLFGTGLVGLLGMNRKKQRTEA